MATQSIPMVSCRSIRKASFSLVPTPSVPLTSTGFRIPVRSSSNSPPKPPSPPMAPGVMALGNVWGGRSADKNPDPDRLYRRILLAAVWIAAIPVAGKYVIVAISGALVLTVSTNLLIIAAFLSCAVIFVFPLFLLGTVTPSLVKYTVESLEDSGKTVGALGAANTIGSIIGTFVPTFITIPAVGTAITFLIFSGILLAIGLIYFLSGKAGRRFCTLSLVLFTLCSIFGHSGSFAFWESNLGYEGESIYNYLQVKDWEDRTILSTNVLFGVQSVKMKEAGLTGMLHTHGARTGATAAVRGAEGLVEIEVDDIEAHD